MEVNSNLNDSKIFINDQITQYNKKLLRLANKMSKNYYNFTYEWTNKGRVFLHKQEGGQVYTISKFETV